MNNSNFNEKAKIRRVGKLENCWNWKKYGKFMEIRKNGKNKKVGKMWKSGKS